MTEPKQPDTSWKGKVSIDRGTTISLSLVIMLIAFTVSILLSWMDLKDEISTLSYRMDAQTRDRWTRTQDQMLMFEFAIKNDLKLPNYSSFQSISSEEEGK